MLLEALGMLLWAWFTVRIIGFTRYAKRLGIASSGEYVDENVQDELQLKQVRWSIDAINRFFGSGFNCLMQGTAGKLMLNRRGVSNTLVLGTKISSPDTSGVSAKKFEAHAWLWAGQAIILGGETHHEYTPMTSYYSG